ncbi:unnamed protein product [Urochloa decumbens]|uniref:Disease resistance protein RPM1 n=1 Tax=Urochloa decumbens TaxID=240449 RepID=A0ABC8YY41_9POAL
MADFVVGMAKSVVDGVLTKTQAAMDEEAKLRQSAHRDLVFITGEFQMMQSFLNVANANKQDRCKNQVIRTLVRQIRDLAYDVEDCIEFVVHLDKKNRWWLRLLHPARCIIRCLPEIPLDVAVADIEQLKAMVEDVSRRNERYSHGLITNAGSDSSPPEPVSRATVGATEFNRLIEATENLREPQGDLTQLLTKEDGGLQVISIWGTGGGYPGMASIIWSAYADKDTSNTFTCRAWVKLRHPFNPRGFVRSVMAQFHASKPQEDKQGDVIPVDVLKMMKCKQGVLLPEFVTYVNEKKYLLVLEGLSTMEEWNAIKTFFPNRNNGSCIIVSTQQFEVASLSVGHPFQVLDLNHHSAEHSVFAFSQRGSEHDGAQGAQTIDDSVSSRMNAITSKKDSAQEWMMSNRLVGRESLMNDLRKDTADAVFGSYHVMSVWGIAGVGKSSLVRTLFCERILMKRSIHQMYGWVDVSHPFNLRDLSRCLLLSLHSESVEAMETSYYDNIGSENPIVQCQKMLEQNRCLVVIDGLQCTKEWDLIKAGLLGSGYHDRTLFIVITNDEKIARHCRGDKGEFVFNVTGLEPDAAFHLFRQISSKNVSSLLDSELSELRELTSKCGGLPKVIVEVASSLASKTVGWMEHARSMKKKFIQALETNPELNKFEGLHDWMNAYFRNCPDVLKPCVYYLSIFPQDHIIRRRRLVRRWIAEGYSSNSHDKSAEENGEKHFSDLLDRRIIQQPSEIGSLGNMRAVLCQVNGFFREYISSQWMEENLVFELDCSCVLPTQRTGRHLVISRTWKRHRTVFESIDFSRLRSLTLFGVWESFLISENMKVLRVLDLEDASGVNNEDLKNIVKWLGRLKFLSLRGCQNISDLPSALGHLRQLQTLDLRGTSIRTLPKNIAKLQKLQYIRAGKTKQGEGPFLGVKVPPGIGKLTVLHTLGVVNIGVSGTTVLEELRKLTLLHKLGVTGINKSNSNKFFSAISDLALMESLSMRLDKDSQGCLDLKALALESLRSLKLYGLGNMLPEWTKKLSRLAKLDLEMEALMKKDIEFIGKLQELCIVRLRAKRLQDGEFQFCVIKNGVEDDSYKKLKILDIGCSLSVHVTFGSRTMKKLELLKVDCSSTSPLQFLGLENLSELKEVVLLEGYSDESLKAHLQEHLAQHLRKPVVTYT